jgi:hypothetical protein
MSDSVADENSNEKEGTVRHKISYLEFPNSFAFPQNEEFIF